MAFDASNLVLISSANGFGRYRYDTTDTLTTIEVAGYFNNVDDVVNFGIGDTIEAVVWVTAVRAGTVSIFGQLVVTQIDNAGALTTDDGLLGTVVD